MLPPRFHYHTDDLCLFRAQFLISSRLLLLPYSTSAPAVATRSQTAQHFLSCPIRLSDVLIGRIHRRRRLAAGGGDPLRLPLIGDQIAAGEYPS